MDIADVSLKAESGDIVTATTNLTSFARAGDVAAAAADRFQAGAERARSVSARLQQSINELTGVAGKLSTEMRANDIMAYGQEMDRLRAKYNPMFAAQTAYKNSLTEIRQAHRVGALSTREMAEAVESTKVKFISQVNNLKGYSNTLSDAIRPAKNLKDATKDAADETGKAATQFGLARYELINLSRQAQDIVVSLKGGQSFGTVMMQQGSQVFDVFQNTQGTVGGFFKQVTGYLSSYLTLGRVVFGGIAAAVAAGALAYSSYASTQEAVRMGLLGVGRASGATAKDINNVAAAVSSLKGFSTSEATQFATALASTGRIAKENLMPAVQAGHDLAKVLGVDAAAAGQEMAKALMGNFDSLNARLGAFSIATQEQFKSLMAQNRQAEAQALIIQKIKEATAGASEVTGGWSKAWNALANAASNAWTAIGRGIDRATGMSDKTIADQYKAARTELESLQKQKADTAKEAEYYKSIGMSDKDIKAMLPALDIVDSAIMRAEASIAKFKKGLDDSKTSADAVKASMQSIADQSTVTALSPEIAARRGLSNQTATALSIAGDSTRQSALGITQAQADEQVKRAKSVEDGYKTAAEHIKEGFDVANQAITAFSPQQKAAIAALQTEISLRDNPNLSGEDKKIAKQQAYNNALKEGLTQISESNRARELSANQAIANEQLEIDMLGKSIGKQAEMRANLQARQQLEQEASRMHTQVDEAEYARLQKINEKLGQRAQLRAEKTVDESIKFGQQTALLDPGDVAIAQQLKGLYPDVASSLDSVRATAIRTNTALSGFASQISGPMVTGITDMIDGTKTLQQGFTDLSKTVVRAFEEMLVKMAIVAPAMRALQGLVSGFTGFSFGAKDGGLVAARDGGLIHDNKLQRFGWGGRVHGPGGPRSDSVLARLSNGEFVVNAQATATHYSLLRAINDNHRPRFADGGSNGNVTELLAPKVMHTPPTELHVHGAPADKDMTLRETVDGRGQRRLDLTFDDGIAAALSRAGSKTREAMGNQYSARPRVPKR